jgi:hypothetical protein
LLKWERVGWLVQGDITFHGYCVSIRLMGVYINVQHGKRCTRIVLACFVNFIVFLK